MSDRAANATSLTTLLERVEAVAVEVAIERFGDRARRHSEVAQAIRALSDRYIGRDEDPRQSAAARDESRLLAQLLFFTLADLPKAAFAVGELLGAGALASGQAEDRALRVLDVGAGCGAQSLGATLALAGAAGSEARPRVEIDAVDADVEALSLMRSLLARLDFADIELREEVADLLGPTPRGPGGRRRGAVSALFGRRRYDIIVAGSVFNELPAAQHLGLARALLSRLAPGGALVIIEPALRETARALHQLRDELLAERAAYVFAPCTHSASCPMLADERDWCHENRHFVGPPNLRRLASASGLRRRQLKWSYLTLRRERGNVAASPRAARVVSDALRSKGKREIFVCADVGRVRLTRLDRDRAAGNEPWRELRRGKLVQLSDELSAGKMRVGKETELEVQDPAAMIEELSS